MSRDAIDPLAPLRGLFALERVDAQGVLYLDGNSLGPLPKTTIHRMADVVEQEWGVGLIRSWNTAGWITLSQRVADKIARLVGVGPGELVVADSTSVNLYKVLDAALAMASPHSAESSRAPGRRRILSERTDFPSDLYIADTFARAHKLELTLVSAEDIGEQLDNRVAILLLTHVNYRTGRRHDMPSVTRAAHDTGAIVVWNLAHSAGAMPIDLYARGATNDGKMRGGATGMNVAAKIADAADFAIGCGYKYLNGGPGAPAFAWAHPRHTAAMDREGWRQPLSGWFGHAAPFDFSADYRPAGGMARFRCGTPPVLSLAALECGVDTVLAADEHGGLAAIREKSVALTELFIARVESRCAGHDLTLVSPRDPTQRGSQVSFAHPTAGYAIMQALIARGVIGDFRAPDVLRFGVAPLYTRFVDVWDAADRLHQVFATGEWRAPRFHVRTAVT